MLPPQPPFALHGKAKFPPSESFRSRYLTRLFLFYRAQSSIHGLRRVHNRQYLELLVDDPSNSAAQDEAKSFQHAYEVFQLVATDSYQLGGLVLGGPLVAVGTLIAQKALLPLSAYLWKLVGGPPLSLLTADEIGSFSGFLAGFAIMVLWLAVSAWMDMRLVLKDLEVLEVDHRVRMAAGLRLKAAISFDLLFCFLLLAGLVFARYLIPVPLPNDGSDELVTQAQVYAAFLAPIAIIAAARRLYFNRVQRNVASSTRPSAILRSMMRANFTECTKPPQ